MARPKVLALIMAGGEGNRMDILTAERAKPALPFGGVYRLIDFPLSNCVHSGISDVWVIEQFQPQPINEHLANGRPWDLDRTYGGLRIIQPFTGSEESGWHQGNADAIYRNRKAIADFGADIILVLSADHVYKLDYSEVIDQHMENKADVTLVTTKVSRDQATRFGTVELDGDKVVHFDYKPDKARSSVVTTEVFVYDAARLLRALDDLASQKDEQALEDFGHELIPHLVEGGRVFAYALPGYWQDVGVIEDYWSAHMRLLDDPPALNLDDQAWPILTYGAQRMAAHIHATARIENSLVSPGAQIHGEVVRSVIGPGVVVERGARVRDSIIFDDSVVGANAQVAFTIVDQRVTVEAKAHIGDDSSADNLTLVGAGATIAQGARVKAGARIKPHARHA
jgi:glucose-1-phosphate adenylyltransferase